MILWLVQQLLLFRKFVKAQDTPRQLAWGLALGMMIGLVPKGNLVAVVLSMVLLSTRANLAVGMLSAVAFSLVGICLDPLTDALGLAVLNHESLRPTWLRLYRLPLAPWTSLNHGVVMGSLILGLGMLYPCYRLSLPLFDRYLAWRRRSSSDGGPQEPLAESSVESDPSETACCATHVEQPVAAAEPSLETVTAGQAEPIQVPAVPHPVATSPVATSPVATCPVAGPTEALPSSATRGPAPTAHHSAESGLPAPVFLARPRRRHSESETNRVNS